MAQHDCFDVAQYEGRTFVTESGNRYSVISGCLYGRQSINGARIAMIGGGVEQDAVFMKLMLPPTYNPSAAQRLTEHMAKVARPVEKGLALLVVFDDASAQAFKRHGLVSSPIERIDPAEKQ